MGLEEKLPLSLDARIFVEDQLYFSTVGAVRTERGWVCIDTPADPLHAAWWRQTLKTIAPLPILAVIYTDAGRDRVLGTAILMEERPGLVIAHHQAFDRIKSHGEIGRQQVMDALINVGQSESAELLNRTPLVLPNLTFSDRLILNFGSPVLILEHVDGASPGQIWVRIPEHDVVFVGDTVTLNAHPNLSEADLERWLEQLRQLHAGRVARRVIPGRGPLVEPKGVSPVLDYLKTLLKRVKTLAGGRRKVELGPLVNEFMAYFPVPEHDRERIQRRIRLSLERLLELYAEGKKMEAGKAAMAKAGSRKKT
ncbi:MBL fold metallo-hydrolase [Thermoflexus sp.]|uniref:MBL fold metallo-hydrolase n=1 Tax=Thermoflexus sp. TaxID=1969742 RepID=UPI0025CF2D4C|nr:MBL fold metallo-hydrolase [Thermoflexus sp.]MDW8064545.1 MBL fold metallo-hydrolase [Anaerolineae bacterium]MCS6964900.1 MBL fold metallo-hydrolase [Thermoflexus sp.]MCS7350734.1 MBL fold metallo-hydrolase [Thermoflexus sp.]MCX7691403.1 MBL fold metallo-hydrolase [Thermoflexus sp.]MDW8180185.1 MBL fold metallo-hydrolase [Anaerolineae bacterium]